MKKFGWRRLPGVLAAAWAAIFFVGASFRVLADCASFGLPFTDLGATSFCAAIAEAYYTGITNGTSSTTFAPNDNVTRAQAAAFATRTLDAGLVRGSRRAALGHWWTTTPHWDLGLGITSVGTSPALLASDGADLWVANSGDDSISRVRAADGAVLQTWTGATGAFGVLIAMGRVFITGNTEPGALYMIDPSQDPGAVTTLASNLGNNPRGIGFDGSRIWTANSNDGPSGGSVSIITPGSTLPWGVVTISNGFSSPTGVVFDRSNIWVSDGAAARLRKLDSAGAVLQSIPLSAPSYPTFDGANIWVPNTGANTVSVVRPSDGVVLRVVSGNGLFAPLSAAFDGQRILVANLFGGVSLWNAATLHPIGTFSTPDGSSPYGACSDGINFWVALSGSAAVGRF